MTTDNLDADAASEMVALAKSAEATIAKLRARVATLESQLCLVSVALDMWEGRAPDPDERKDEDLNQEGVRLGHRVHRALAETFERHARAYDEVGALVPRLPKV